jgi:hypothetical protein
LKKGVPQGLQMTGNTNEDAGTSNAGGKRYFFHFPKDTREFISVSGSQKTIPIIGSLPYARMRRSGGMYVLYFSVRPGGMPLVKQVLGGHEYRKVRQVLDRYAVPGIEH